MGFIKYQTKVVFELKIELLKSLESLDTKGIYFLNTQIKMDIKWYIYMVKRRKCID